jgi:hypothetical protein
MRAVSGEAYKERGAVEEEEEEAPGAAAAAEVEAGEEASRHPPSYLFNLHLIWPGIIPWNYKCQLLTSAKCGEGNFSRCGLHLCWTSEKGTTAAYRIFSPAPLVCAEATHQDPGSRSGLLK